METVIKCQKGTGSAWGKNTMKSCVFTSNRFAVQKAVIREKGLPLSPAF